MMPRLLIHRIASIALCLWLIAVCWQPPAVQAQDSSEFTEAVERYRTRIRKEPENLELHRQMIEHARQTNRLAVPLYIYTISYEKQPTNTTVLYVLGYSYLIDASETALMEAERLFQAAIAEHSQFAEAYVALGRCYIAQGKTEAGFEAFQKSLQINPNFWEANLELGNYYRDQKDYRSAIEHYMQSLAPRPKAATTHFNLGTVYRIMGKLEAARQAFAQASKHDKKYADAYYQLGQIYALQGKPDDALKQYRKGQRLDPNNANVRYQLAHIFLDQNDERHAILSVRSALAIDAKYVEYVERLEDVSISRAAEIIAQILQEHPDNADLQHFAGELILKIDLPEGTRQCLERSKALDPNLVDAHYARGIAYDQMGEMEKAMAEFQKAAELNPNDPRPHLYLGKRYANGGQPRKAISAFAKAIEADPENVEALKDYAFLCLAYDEKGGWKRAKRALETAIQIRPGDPEILMNYGHTLLMSQENHEAIIYYLRAIELKPDWVLSHYNLAIAYETIGKKKLALAEYQKVMQLDLEGSYGEKASERIRVLEEEK